MAELDVLRRLGDQIVPPQFEALRDTARRRARQARLAAGVAVVASVAVVSATTLYLTSPGDRQVEPAPSVPTSRPLIYADVSTIHYGERTVEADGPVVELDVTDDGVGFRTRDGQISFTDGSTIDHIGMLGETGPGYGDPWPMTTAPGWMASANSGSRLVWFEFPAPGKPEVVVYDTRTGQEVVRDTVQLGPGHTAVPGLVTDRFVYWFKDPDSGQPPEDQTQVRYDPTTREQSRITEPELLEDLDSEAAVRSVRLKGDGRADSSGMFHYSDGMGLQMSVDLKKDAADVDGVAPVGPGDMKAEDVHGRPFAFEPPASTNDKTGVAWLVQWLDNRTVVVLTPLQQSTDLIVCHIDTGTCEVAASAPAGIVVPDFGKSEFIG